VTGGPSARGARWTIVAGAAAFLLGALLYLPTARNGFVFDDIDVVQKNPLAQDPSALGAIFGTHYWAGLQPTGNLYRPLTILSFALNHAITGAAPAGFHVVNALLHGVAAALVVALASGLGWSAAGALAAGLLFAAHPVHVEAVTPVVGRSELLAAIFGIAAWIGHLSATRPGRSAGRGAAMTAGAALLFGAALLSKEGAAVVPALALAGDLTLRRREPGRSSRHVSIACMLGVLLIYLIARAAIVPGAPPDDPLVSVFGGVGALTRWRTAVGVLGRYFWLLLFPLHLSADYSFEQIPLIRSAADPLFLFSALSCAALAAGGTLLAARGRRSGLSILIVLGALFPVSNLPFSIGTVMGERLLYLPSLGFCLLLPALFDESGTLRDRRIGRGAAAALLSVVCLLHGARVVVRNDDWRDQVTLFKVTVRTSPRSAKAHYNLGVAEDERGDLQAAMEEYRRAVEIKPDQAQPWRNSGLDLLQMKRPQAALDDLSRAARLDPGIADVFGDVGIALHQLGRAKEAEAAFREEIARRPNAWRALYNLGSLLLEQGRLQESLDALSRSASLNPQDPDTRAQMGFVLASLGRHQEALSSFSEAIRLNPASDDLLVPLARSALAIGRTDLARGAVDRALAGGVNVPNDLRERVR
jgi:tetratricopeptide (TPR) repeat protein